MIYLYLNNHSFFYEAEDIIRMYFGKQEIKRTKENFTESDVLLKSDELFLASSIEYLEGSCRCTAKLYTDCMQDEYSLDLNNPHPSEKSLKKLLKRTMYKLLTRAYGKEFPWGILTGIRPVKLVHDFMDKGFSEEEVKEKLKDEYLVSDDRAVLALKIAKIEKPFIYPVEPDSVSIYIGIPFCPSRCYYCSFASNPINRYNKLVEPYLYALMKEIREISRYMKERNLIAQTIYIGGGTPTSINDRELKSLIRCIVECFGSSVSEFTCEAGRPDSITEEKLKILKAGGVSRISINPQTMNDETLRRIGRSHNTDEIRKSFKEARKAGFDNINMDIILGLPGETLQDVRNTLSEIKKLDPESITVHTLAIKRASVYNEVFKESSLPDDEAVKDMMEYTKEFITNMGMQPYYLYRQKHMAQNLENIGFSKNGFECIYNMQIIEEKQTIIAFGADAVTKTVIHDNNRIERQHNIKDVQLYIESIDTMIEKKIEILDELLK